MALHERNLIQRCIDGTSNTVPCHLVVPLIHCPAGAAVFRLTHDFDWLRISSVEPLVSTKTSRIIFLFSSLSHIQNVGRVSRTDVFDVVFRVEY